MHESEKLPREAANFAHHGFVLAKRLHEALVVGALRFLDGELPPSDEPSEHAPGLRWASKGVGPRALGARSGKAPAVTNLRTVR